MKIKATVSTSKCPCGCGTVSNYDTYIDFVEKNSYIIRCDKCKDKYTVRYNPCTKRMFFIDRNNLISWRWINEVSLTKMEKAHYDNEYEYSLAELDALEEEIYR